MSTTLLFVELLIIGIQSCVWILLIFLNIYGLSWFKAFFALNIKDWQSIILLISLAFVYTLGVVVDRIADILFSRWNEKIKKNVFSSAWDKLGVMRFAVTKENEKLDRQLEYTRSRMRIARGSVLNIGLSTFFLTIFIVFRSQATNKWIHLLSILGVGVLLVTAATIAWRKLVYTHSLAVKANYEYYVLKQPIAYGEIKTGDDPNG